MKGPKKEKMVELIARAWKDREFKKRLLANPKSVLKEFGCNIPENVKIQFHENTNDTVHYVLPRSPARTRELSDAELERLSAAAGDDTLCQCSYGGGVYTC